MGLYISSHPTREAAIEAAILETTGKPLVDGNPYIVFVIQSRGCFYADASGFIRTFERLISAYASGVLYEIYEGVEEYLP